MLIFYYFISLKSLQAMEKGSKMLYADGLSRESGYCLLKGWSANLERHELKICSKTLSKLLQQPSMFSNFFLFQNASKCFSSWMASFSKVTLNVQRWRSTDVQTHTAHFPLWASELSRKWEMAWGLEFSVGAWELRLAWVFCWFLNRKAGISRRKDLVREKRMKNGPKLNGKTEKLALKR